MPLPGSVSRSAELSAKPVAREPCRVLTAPVRGEALTRVCGFEYSNRVNQPGRGLRVEQDPRGFGRVEAAHRLRCPSLAICNHGDAAGLRFDRRDAKIFLGRERKGAGTL